MTYSYISRVLFEPLFEKAGKMESPFKYCGECEEVCKLLRCMIPSSSSRVLSLCKLCVGFQSEIRKFMRLECALIDECEESDINGCTLCFMRELILTTHPEMNVEAVERCEDCNRYVESMRRLFQSNREIKRD